MSFSLDGIDYSFSSRLPKNAERSSQYILLRVLLGAADVGRGAVRFKQSMDLSVWPAIKQSSRGAGSVRAYLSANVGVSVDEFIKITTADNRRLFQEILAEFSNYFVATQRGAHATAFVYLYRTLERLSFSLPLLYFSTSSDFVGTFNDLKALFKEGGGGDLDLLRKFLLQGKLIDPLVLSMPRRMDFSPSPNGARFYAAVTSRFTGFTLADPTRLQVEVEYRRVLGLFVMIRNRFFHLRSGDGQKNISSRDLHDADEFFCIANEMFCNFLAVLTLSSTARKYRK
ncbi:hypothetical protein [Lysobacter soli]|uniref:hypothetical protein n=1 Tax=Lysobacter soli TaxID=453783 RepID=UPI003CF87E04